MLPLSMHRCTGRKRSGWHDNTCTQHACEKKWWQSGSVSAHPIFTRVVSSFVFVDGHSSCHGADYCEQV